MIKLADAVESLRAMTAPTARRRRSRSAAIALGCALGSMLAACGATATSPSSAFSPYVDVTLSPGHLVATVTAAHVRNVTLGFIGSAGGRCAPSWGGSAADQATIDGDVGALRHHSAYMISFGGRDGTDLAVACSSVAALRDQYAAIIARYGVHRLDFDIEGAALQDSASIARRWQALALLGPGVAASVTLPVDPTGLTAPGLAVLRAAIAAGVTPQRINLLTMDFGDASAPRPAGRMFAYVTRAAAATSRQLRRLYPKLSQARRQRLLWVTPMIGVNDTTDEVFKQADARAVVAYAGITGLGGLSMWSLGRDRPCPRSVRAAQPDCSGVSQKRFEFARTLGRYTGP